MRYAQFNVIDTIVTFPGSGDFLALENHFKLWIMLLHMALWNYRLPILLPIIKR